MSPLVTSPNRGYADWQRVNNYDSGILFSENGVIHNGGFNSPILDVSRYAYIGGAELSQAGAMAVTVSWFTAPVNTTQIGTRHFILSPLIQNPAQIRLPNLGPFVQMGYNNAGAASYQHVGYVFGTNRVHPLEFIPQFAMIIQNQTISAPASTSVFLYPLDYYAGPIQVWNNAPAGTAHYGIQILDGSGNWQFVTYQAMPTAASSVVWIAPPGAWRIYLENNTGVTASFEISVTSSTTGAT